MKFEWNNEKLENGKLKGKSRSQYAAFTRLTNILLAFHQKHYGKIGKNKTERKKH